VGWSVSEPERVRRTGKSTQTRPGDHYLKAALGIAVLAVSRSKTTYLAVKYRRIQSHAGALRAVVALQHTLLVIVWNMLHDGVVYDELGVDHFDKTNPERAKKSASTPNGLARIRAHPHPNFHSNVTFVFLVDTSSWTEKGSAVRKGIP
jgi:hypothetical protein